jgi:hypothetical protein
MLMAYDWFAPGFSWLLEFYGYNKASLRVTSEEEIPWLSCDIRSGTLCYEMEEEDWQVHYVDRHMSGPDLMSNNYTKGNLLITFI